MRKNLTIKQQKVFDFIIKYIKDNGYPPTVRDIAGEFKMSSKGAYDHMLAIEKKGYIKRDPTKPRAIELMDFIHRDPSDPIVSVPVLGRVAAGEPLLAIQNIERTITISSDMVRTEDPFALKVKGNSMIEAGILEDDFVIVRQQRTAEQGDIVVALIGDDATVKRFYKEGGHIRLQPENSSMEPIIVKDVTILGKVVGLYRQV